ncbi:MAG TPA: VanZ family protein [Ornithinibacter sp.]|nr:VanZ family protein [Ornithinibacter sp.]
MTGVAAVAAAPVTPTRAPAGGRLATLFVVYLVLLVWTVLWKLEVPWVGGDRMVKVVPFVATDGAGASAPLEVVVNLLLFVPFGLYLGLLVPGRPWWALAGAVAGSSLALEVGQYLLAVGRSDATDVVVNTGGGLVGLGLAAAARHRAGAGAARAMTRACAVATALTLVVAGLYLVSPRHVVHVRDVGPLARVDLPRTVP